MAHVNVQEAKTRLSQLLAAAERGEEVVIARGGRPVVRLVPIGDPQPRPVGFVAGSVPQSFFEPPPGGELSPWGGPRSFSPPTPPCGSCWVPIASPLRPPRPC